MGKDRKKNNYQSRRDARVRVCGACPFFVQGAEIAGSHFLGFIKANSQLFRV